jgi:hypothetical protein
LPLVILLVFVPLYLIFWGPWQGGLAMTRVETDFGDQSGPNWKSPIRKLARFFKRSRDRWKAKYAAKKQQYKLMGNQARAVEKSRAKWRQAAEQAQQRVRELQKELEQYKKSPA